MTMMTMQTHQTLVNKLVAHGLDRDASLTQTHISSVVAIGDRAYKLKKPLNLEFLDFSTLARRHDACEAEVRLNRRLAPDLYLGVVPVTGTPERPVIDGDGEPIEWAVAMRRFDPTRVLAQMPQRVDDDLIDRLAERIAAFHQAAGVAPAGFGSPETVIRTMDDNLRQIRARRSAERAQLDKLSDWLAAQQGQLGEQLAARQAGGFIRECHGDLHLNNIVLIDGEPVIFDGIEFNDELRDIDVIADLAFLTMDLRRLGRDGQAFRLLDRYLAITGDFDGLALLRLYEVYRAMVRAKVAAIHAGERNLGADEREQIVAELRRYLRVAQRLTRAPRPALVITHGVAGTGKSTASNALLHELPAVRLRSDVERKRLANGAADRADLYSEAMTARTYDRLAELAGKVMDAGYVAVVDATFLDGAQRERFAALAQRREVPFLILSCDAPVGELVERLQTRAEAGVDPSDADVAVLQRQQQRARPLSEAEGIMAVKVSPDHPLDPLQVAERLGY